MSEPISAGAALGVAVTAGGITIFGIATGLHPALLLAGAAGGWWAMSYQSATSVLGRMHRIVISALVAAWGAPALSMLGWMPEAIPDQVLQLVLALIIGLTTIDVLGRGLMALARRKLNAEAEK